MLSPEPAQLLLCGHGRTSTLFARVLILGNLEKLSRLGQSIMLLVQRYMRLFEKALRRGHFRVSKSRLRVPCEGTIYSPPKSYRFRLF